MPHINIELVKSRFNDKSTTLDLNRAGLHDDDIPILIRDVLNQHQHITSLELSDNNLGNDCTSQLAALPWIKILDLSRNNISARGVRALAESANLEKLDLSENFLDDAAADILSKYSRQSELNVSKNRNMSKEATNKVARRIAENNEKRLIYNAKFFANPVLKPDAEPKLPKEMKSEESSGILKLLNQIFKFN